MAPLRTKFLTGLPFLIIASLLILFFHDVIFFGKTLSSSSLLPGATLQGPYGFSGYRPKMPFSFDTAGNAWVNEPNPYIIKEVLNEGSLPAWNPHEGFGMPLTANLNNEIFNPLKLFLNFFPTPFSQDIFFLLRLLIMGLFTYLFLREMKLSQAPALLGSSFFMLSGYSVWWINLHPLSTVMYLPAVFYFYERWSEGKDAKSPFLMSLCLSFALMSGKIPDVVMGLALLFLYGLWKGALRDSFRGILREGARVTGGTVSGALMASVALLPFVELYAHASPLAKALRTGSASHTLPLITSASLVQPLFLGWGNYFYGSWLKWTPDLLLPHAGIVIATLSLYAMFNISTLKKLLPFFLFPFLIFAVIYGLLPSHIISRIPVLGSIEILKYNAMFCFSLAVMAASAFDHLLSEAGERKKFYVSIALIGSLILTYFFFLYSKSPPGLRGYMVVTLVVSLCGMLFMGLALCLTKGRRFFGFLVFLLLVFELFLYMPRDHPDRTDPYREPPYLHAVKEEIPYRFSGGGGIIPPLVSNAFGLYDMRAVNVLLPGDYYRFFENLLSFSMPQTNNPNALFFATSPFIDLVGVKYILSQELLESRTLDGEVKTHLKSLRWIRFLDAMVSHTVKGGATYGFFDPGGEERFAFFFPMNFILRARLRVSEPFLFVGLALRNASKGETGRVRIALESERNELMIENGRWKDKWIDISRYIGKEVTLTIEGEGSGQGAVALGDFGLSPGPERERSMYDTLLALHKKEFDFLKYRGVYEGIHIYENRNVMDRAFMVHKTETVRNLDEVIEKLQENINFREVGLVAVPGLPLHEGRGKESFSPFTEEKKSEKELFDDKVVIKQYAADRVAIEVESKGGLLVLSDLYYPGWKVKVNGEESRIIKVFGLLRGVAVGGGKTEILFYYQPMSLCAGFVVSMLTLIAWVGFFVISRRRATLH